MRFMLEATNPLPRWRKQPPEGLTEQEKAQVRQNIVKKYAETSSQSERYTLINDWIKLHPEYNKIKASASTIVDSILDTDSFDEKENEFLSYINKVGSKSEIYGEQSDLIYKLYKNGKLDFNAPWLYDENIYKLDNGNPSDSLYRIKAFTFANNPKLSMDYGDPQNLSVDNFYNKDGSIKPVSDIKSILNDFQTKQPELDDEKKTQAEDIIQDQRLQDATYVLSQLGLNKEQIGKAFAAINLLPEYTAGEYVSKILQNYRGRK